MRRTPKENINQSFINLIRKAHGLIENSDIREASSFPGSDGSFVWKQPGSSSDGNHRRINVR